MASRERPFNPTLDFEPQVQRGAVTTSKMGTIDAQVITAGSMSANRIYGGTLTLGGTNDVSGVFSLQEQGGTEIVKMDKGGITVSHGSITIKDTAGSSVIDSSGLVSNTSFKNGLGQSGTAAAHITSLTYADIAGGSVAYTLARAANVLYSFTISGYHLDFDGVAYVGMYDAVDGGGETAFGPICSFFASRSGGGGDTPETHNVTWIENEAVGTHAVKLKGRQTNNPGTAVLGGGAVGPHTSLLYIVLGA